jgi:hypothetical protein
MRVYSAQHLWRLYGSYVEAIDNALSSMEVTDQNYDALFNAELRCSRTILSHAAHSMFTYTQRRHNSCKHLERKRLNVRPGLIALVRESVSGPHREEANRINIYRFGRK